MEDMVRSLVAIAAADGRIGKRERRLIEAFAERWGVAGDVVEQALADAGRGDLRVRLPESKGDQRTLLKAMVRVAAADGVMEAPEKDVLLAVAKQIGTSPEDLDGLIARHLSAPSDEGEAGDAKAGTRRARREPRAREPEAPAAEAQTAPRARAEGPAAAGQVGPRIHAGEPATPVGLGQSKDYVFGDVPWKPGVTSVVPCGFCGESIPRAMIACPFCEQPQGQASVPGPGAALAALDPRGKLALAAVFVVAFVFLPWQFGAQDARRAREDAAEAAKALDAEPTPAEVDLAGKELAEQTKEARAQVEAQERELAGLKAEIARLKDPRALERERERPRLLEEAKRRRDQEFERAFPGRAR